MPNHLMQFLGLPKPCLEKCHEFPGQENVCHTFAAPKPGNPPKAAIGVISFTQVGWLYTWKAKESPIFKGKSCWVLGVKLPKKKWTLGVPGRDYKWFTNNWLVIQGL